MAQYIYQLLLSLFNIEVYKYPIMSVEELDVYANSL